MYILGKEDRFMSNGNDSFWDLGDFTKNKVNPVQKSVSRDTQAIEVSVNSKDNITANIQDKSVHFQHLQNFPTL